MKCLVWWGGGPTPGFIIPATVMQFLVVTERERSEYDGTVYERDEVKALVNTGGHVRVMGLGEIKLIEEAA